MRRLHKGLFYHHGGVRNLVLLKVKNIFRKYFYPIYLSEYTQNNNDKLYVPFILKQTDIVFIKFK